MAMKQTVSPGPVPGESPAPLPSWRPGALRQPDWESLKRTAEAKGAEDAASPGFDSITLKTQGYEPPHLLVLDAQRQLAVDDLTAQLAQEELAVRTAQAAHVKRAEAVGHDYARARAVHETVRGRVERLEIGPSQWPGDGKPSSIALDGGWREVLKQWGVPLLLLLVLLTVEVPIYYQTFLNWGESTVMTYAFALGAIFVFVFGPHFYGRKFREWEEFRGWRRHAADAGGSGHPNERDDGRPRRRGLAGRPVILFLIPVIWLAAIAAVASLRLLVIDDVTYVDSEGVVREAPSLIEGWGLIPTVILVFALMIFTALIATELGRRMGNPNDRDLKEQRAGLRRAAQALKAAEARQSESDAYAAELAQYLSTARQNRETHTMRIEGGFDHLETIYMDALIRRIDDPKASLYGPSVLDRHQRRRHDYNQSDT
ncbi:hypothetical protein GCM10023194_37110 [Planotetraspora phitsanulokensis]|uniref:Uncharacterized protein n=1 Tax=Planotetraspora phitsanulokensis TaxID=575192 RepID=A0A8J3U395_9ACTN|nr:hypothetical protein [Planotetraspora phitsanulokensis]GII36162.1 hypothetical protein Pph01_11650 [Planotetraspora phitsanulokensis]